MGPTEQPAVVVTGASAWIGSSVVRDLARDHVVIGLDADVPAEAVGRIPCDLTRDDSTAAAFSEIGARFGPRIASVVHLATHRDPSDRPEETRRLVRELRRGRFRRPFGLAPFEVEQLLLASSLLVHRPVPKGQVIDEDSPLEDAGESSRDFARSMIEAESVVAAERGPVPAVILRVAAAYDEDGRSPALAHHVRRIHAKALESLFFPGDPSHGQPFVHVEDLVRCIRACVERRKTLDGSEVFLVGEPEVVDHRGLQELIGEAIHGREWPTIRVPRALARAGSWLVEKTSGDLDPFLDPRRNEPLDAHRPIRIDRARRRLGWSPRHRLRDELPGIVGKMLADPAAWYARNGLEPPRKLRPGE
jgi:dihydroflavonol-4-reductase